MTITPDAIAALTFFILPGYIGLRVFEWLVAGSLRSALDEVVWSLTFSILGSVPLLAIDRARILIEHLWRPDAWDVYSIGGVLVHLLSTVMIALVGGYIAHKADTAGLSRLSIFPHSWDGLWSPIASEHRRIVVETDHGIYQGDLMLADRGQIGRDLVLRNPLRWDESGADFVSTGAELMYIAGASISSVQVSKQRVGEG